MPRSLETIAPERSVELGDVLASVQLELSECSQRIHSYSPSERTVRLSSRVLELLWAQSYAYFVWYSEELAGVQPNGQRVDPRRKPEVNRALDLLGWATRALVHHEDEPWPDNVPSPATMPAEGSYLHIAQEISLFAIGFLLHHEIAHHRLRHQAVEDLDQERDADYGAIDWILQGVDADSAGYKKRVFGSAVALLYIVVHGVYTAQHGGGSHPKDYNRLMFTMQRHTSRDRDDVWGFIGGMLGLYMQDAGIQCPPGPFDNHYQWCDALADKLSRREVNP